MKIVSMSIALLPMLFIYGCGVPTTGSSAGVSRSESTVTSRLLAGERSRATETSLWTYDLKVEVVGNGPAFGFYQSSILDVYGLYNPSSSDYWHCFNQDGWPDSYAVEARYDPWTSDFGKLYVEVIVEDYAHPRSMDVVYSTSFDIDWAED
ncbi:MAG TPA: hypothetical protein EYO33_08655 [Phycisphaerales bacterium]|nr:hypothetical protein [Phycisphaerales bacterium]